jgi:colicin import membrane protein
MAAQEMILKLIFNDDGTFKGLEEINAELEKTDKNTQKVEEATKTLAQQYKILKKEQDQYDPGTEKFNELSIKMGELKDRMNDAADAVRANTGPAVEGLRNSFGLMGEQLRNLDFEGLTQSVQLFTGNLSKVSVSSITSSLKAMLAAGIQGFKTLGNVIKQNPIFLLVGAIIAIYTYWKELSDFVTGKSRMLENLKAQAETLKAQEQSLTRELALQKALGAGAAAILQTELALLKNKQTQAEVAMQIAYLEKDREAFLTAQQAQLQAINELELRKVKINTDAQALLDKIRASTDDQYNKQLLQNQAFSEYKARTEELGVLQQLNAERIKQLNYDILMAQTSGNNELAKKLQLEQQSLTNQNISLQNNKDEIWNAGEAAKSTVKTEKELEAIAKAKAAAAERKAKADAEAKRIADEALAVDKRLDEVEKARADAKKTALNKELDDTLALQKKEEEAYLAAKKSETELQDLKIRHSQELQGILEKFAQLEQEKADEKAAKLKQLQQEGINQKQAELIELQSIIDAADEANFQSTLSKQEQELMASQEYYFQLKTQAKAAGLDATALVEEQARKENEIKERYRKEDAEKRMANIQSNFEMASLALDALSSLNEATAKGDEASQRKAFERNKNIQKAQATIAMAAGIVQQLAVPQDQLTGMNFVKAAALAAAGVANIVKINQTQFNGSGTGSGGNGDLNAPTGGANAPAIDFSGANMMNNAPGTVETYVLAGNVANALEARQKIIDQSYL